ncbi:MAG: hypothetical protein OEY19_09055 [Gammaproteobacteria bacterium]|nr:hypothetical protein [Gammaproteobacteria bacterium]MDH5630022.1 hypothetical protein [Gammaproteobacteria bacterium]
MPKNNSGIKIDQGLVNKLVFSVVLVIGVCMTTYYLFAIKVDKFGHYYKDEDQFSLAIGVGLLVVAWLMRNWKKL